MRVSVVIPTLNRPGAIVDIVTDFLGQTYDQLEVIIVDQTPTDNERLVEIGAYDQRLHLIHTDTSGTCHARNLGVQTATGDIVIFTDDDCRLPDKNFVAVHTKNYADASVGGIGGQVHDRNIKLNREQSGPVCHVTKTGRVFANATSTVRQDINAPRGGNMSYRRQIILDVGGFDESFRGNAMREETDFSLRVVKAGWRIVYDPEAVADHLGLAGGSRSRDRISWYEDFFFNESYFFLKHFPQTYLPLLWLRKLRPIIACASIYGRFRPRSLAAPWRAFSQAWHLTHQPG